LKNSHSQPNQCIWLLLLYPIDVTETISWLYTSMCVRILYGLAAPAASE
jgi:hypothetical protein